MSALLMVALLATSAPCIDAYGVTVGAEVPCSGVLLPPSEATHAIRCLNIDLPTTEEDLRLCDGKRRVDRSAHIARVEALVARVEEADMALAAMAKCPECERAWWDSPGMGFGAGVMATVAVVVTVVLGTR